MRIPLHPELAAELHALKPPVAKPTDKVFIGKSIAGMWKHKSDLRKAGIPYVDERGRQADFHALRHTLSTNLSKCGITPRVAMAMMRHSDIRLTMKTYTDETLLPLADVLTVLPSFVKAENAIITTPNAGAENSAQIDAQTTGSNGQTLSSSVTKDDGEFLPKVSDIQSFWRELAQTDTVRQDEDSELAAYSNPTAGAISKLLKINGILQRIGHFRANCQQKCQQTW